MAEASSVRERWTSRLGLVLAMAGNAIGLGNFLRFPRLAAEYGGGAFMIPYFVALLLLGIPLMWLEWSMGRFGGEFGHATTAGVFARMWKHPAAKYLGSLGISLPLLFVVFYTYIESWTLAYAWFAATGQPAMESSQDVIASPVLRTAAEVATGINDPLSSSPTHQFLYDYQGVTPPTERKYFHSLAPAMCFWLIAVLINCWIIGRGVSQGIERLAKVAMPALFLFAIVLVIRVLTYTPPGVSDSQRTVWAGLNYVWQPNFDALKDFEVWLMAAGQVFFTLSIGTGTIQCYASYLRRDDDCALTGLTTAATNEFAEVVLGGTIAIPIAVATFGLAATQLIATQGSFNLGFVAMPLIFEQLPGGRIFGTLWFSLLFFAGITSSVGLCQPLVAYLQEAFNLDRRWAAVVCGMLMLLLGLPVVLFLGSGYMDQYDFWVGTFGLVFFSLIEVVLFAWVFGGQEMWHELTRGAEIRIPRVFYYIIRYVVPLYLIVLLVGWLAQSADTAIFLTNVPPEHRQILWLARGSLLLVVAAVATLVWFAQRRIKRHAEENIHP